MRILHVISGLGVGGAERNMARLVRHLGELGHTSWVVSVSGLGPVVADLDSAPTLACELPRRPLRGWRRARAFSDALNPDLVHGWMYHGNLLAALLARRRKRPLLWDVRHSINRLADEKLTTRWVIKASGSAIWRPDTVVFNSESGRRSHQDLGYPRWPQVVIPNGVELQTEVEPVSGGVEPARDGNEGPVVAWVARYHPMKDLETFARGAAEILKRLPKSRFVFVGRGMSTDNASVMATLARHGIAAQASLLGEQDDMGAHYRNFDLVMVSSRGEGTPNVLLESMAAGVPCVSTDVGDAAIVLNDPKRIAPAGNPLALAEAALELLNMPSSARETLIEADRRRVAEDYSVDGWVQSYVDTYRDLLDNR